MRLHSLSLTHFSLIHQAFTQAFDDYLVPMRMDEEQLAAMLHRRGWRPELSVGAWQGDALVGLWLAGIHCDESGPAGYCIATGVLPAARRRGLLQAMAAAVSQRLASRGIRRQRLEVIADNAAALAAYTGLGFQAHRRLDCYRIEQAIVAPPGDWTLQEGQPEEWPCWTLDFEPAIPNSRDSLQRARPPLSLLTARRNGALIGYALHSSAGDIAELAVRADCRRRGVARSLLAATQAAIGAERLGCNNIDAADQAMADLLRGCGGQLWLSQWEMRRA